ncbi:ImmA/IrrE family metallo-endopeptidase [Pseudobacillus badius]|uniref:ImmA/IrrE family metallo-endopeptidase n=1 Tax=Bacillus badius TaxID=1455 RepID=UPI0007B0515B|nr:ImmA/IrrE family metallo-endopeptidase [Bacillus badius]KZN99394.1 peptidase [Bacillus badius]OCS84981.1 peptidase [Bacillus badius]OVE49209.1 DUF955 domain-containing protein [Bacillus badius]TDW00815.1 uncharacterized protein DUF955 [Bacillus badius]
MLSNYHTTPLEDWVTQLYIKLEIFHPSQIDEEFIAKKLRIFLHRKPRPSFFEIVGNYLGITIDCRATQEKQREMFFHELCHILRHCGQQSIMPKAFRDLQEWDAQNFVKYAAIPHHLFKYIDFNQHDLEQHMAELFGVSTELCKTRIEQIKNRSCFYSSTTRNSVSLF